jgi:hypothetical protein
MTAVDALGLGRESFDRQAWAAPGATRGTKGASPPHPGLYAVGLPWLHSEPSSVLAGVGADAEHIVAHIARHREQGVVR